MASRKSAVKGELSEAQISWLLFGHDLLTGIPSPFVDEDEAMECYRQNERDLLKRFKTKRGQNEFPTRYFAIRGMEMPKLGHPITSQALMNPTLRQRLGLGDRVVTPRPEKIPDLLGRIART